MEKTGRFKTTNYYAAICKLDAIQVFSNLPDICYPVAAVLRKDTCCLPILMDDNGKLFCMLAHACRILSARVSELVICDIYPVKRAKTIITEHDYIHDCIGGAVIPTSLKHVEMFSDFSDLF